MNYCIYGFLMILLSLKTLGLHVWNAGGGNYDVDLPDDDRSVGKLKSILADAIRVSPKYQVIATLEGNILDNSTIIIDYDVDAVHLYYAITERNITVVTENDHNNFNITMDPEDDWTTNALIQHIVGRTGVPTCYHQLVRHRDDGYYQPIMFNELIDYYNEAPVMFAVLPFSVEGYQYNSTENELHGLGEEYNFYARLMDGGMIGLNPDMDMDLVIRRIRGVLNIGLTDRLYIFGGTMEGNLVHVDLSELIQANLETNRIVYIITTPDVECNAEFMEFINSNEKIRRPIQ